MNDFEAALNLYDLARRDYYGAQVKVIDLKADLQRTKAQLEDIEAEVIANGGVGEAVIDGKNAEVRAAQLRLILAAHPRHREIAERAQSIETEMAHADALGNDAANRMSMARRSMDWAITSTQREAATEAGLGVERKHSNG